MAIQLYIPLVYPNQNKEHYKEDVVLKKLKPILELDSLKIIGQNIKYDALILKRYNIELNNIYFDTMGAESLISPEKNSYKLDLLSKEYKVKVVDVSEMAKVDAGLSCMSIRWEKPHK